MKKTGKKFAALFLSAAMCATLLAGCGDKPTSTSNSTSTSTSASASTETSVSKVDTEASVSIEPLTETSTYHEAPMLADLVTAGKLPKVEDRIPNPENVFVERTDATGAALEIGNYGGILNLGPAGGSWGLSRPTLESIIRYNTDGSYYPNVIKAFEHNDDYTVWTFRLREGMRWSDGEIFDADDITFWYYMCHLNNFDSKKSWAALKETVNDEDAWAKLTKVDQWTVTWTFVNPKYPADFIMNGDFKFCWAPEHYLHDLIPESEQFPYVENEYWPATGLSEEQVLANALKKNIDSATAKDLGKAIVYNAWNTAGIPSLNNFVLSTTPGNSKKDDPLCIQNRNPYFWKVDAEGNQLPYLDALYWNQTSADGQELLMFRDGTIDMTDIAMQDIASVLADMGDKAQLRSYASSDWGGVQITFNYTNEDPHYAELFAKPEFRQAMSICVDRNQVSELLSDGFLEPGQCAPSLGNFGYDPEWEVKWTDYDVAKAKQLLEGCGLKMGSDGFYDFADGTDLMITFLEYDGTQDETYPVLEQYYKAVGINCALKNLEVGAFDNEVRNTRNWTAVMGPHTSIGGLSLYDRVAPFVPVQGDAAEWYSLYGKWYQTKGEQGVEPPAEMKQLLDYYEQWAGTPDADKKDEYALKIYDVHKQNLWSIAYLKAAGQYVVISSKIHNYANNLVDADLYQYKNMAHYEVLFKVD